MAQTGKTKRPARPSRQPSRDPRIDSTPPPREETAYRVSSRPSVNAMPVRIAALEAEVARLKEERSEEADNLAAMLVRVAEVETARTLATQRAQGLEKRIAELNEQIAEMQAWEPPAPTAQDASHVAELTAQLQRTEANAAELDRRLALAEAVTAGLRSRLAAAEDVATEARSKLAATERKVEELQQELGGAHTVVELATSRAVLAEASAADGAAALESTKAELQAERARFVDLESRLTRVRREYAEATEAARRELLGTVEAAQRARVEERDALEQRHAEELQARERRDTETAAALRDQHATALSTQRREHEAATEASLREYLTELSSLEKKHAAEIESLVHGHDEAVRTLEEKHAQDAAAMREEHAAAKRAAARALEEERSAAAKARQQALTAESSLTALRGAAERAAQVLDELERREEMAASLRARAIDQAKQALVVPDSGSKGASLPPPRHPAPPPVPQSGVEAVSLDEMELDFPGSPGTVK